MGEELDIGTTVKNTLPTISDYIGTGLTSGIVGEATGFHPLVVTLVSLLVYAGSTQLITVNMLASHSPLLSIVFSTFLVNSRVILISMTIAPYFKKNRLLQNLLIDTLLTDESSALGINKLSHTGQKLSFRWMNTADWISYLTWVSSSLVNTLLGDFIIDPKKLGLDFAIAAIFIGLLYLQVISDRNTSKRLQLILIGLASILVYIGLIFTPSNLVVVVVALIGCGLGVWIKYAFF